MVDFISQKAIKRGKYHSFSDFLNKGKKKMMIFQECSNILMGLCWPHVH